MPIPDFQSLMLPLLNIAADGLEHSVRDVKNSLAEQFSLTPEDRAKLLPSGADKVFNNRFGWAQTHLKFANLIRYPKRGFVQITDRGKEVLSGGAQVNTRLLRQYPEYIAFVSGTKGTKEEVKASDDRPGDEVDEYPQKTPQEQIEAGYLKLRHELEAELLARVKACSPEFFEEMVVKLLVNMGYGGSLSDAGQAIGKSGDGGIDGVIKEDRLGLDVIYIQAKRWDNSTVGSPEIQKFVGALQGKKARRGVFITTSAYSKAAYDYASTIATKVVLIDGQKLAELMFDFGVGATTVKAYEVKAIDNDFFEDSEGEVATAAHA